MLTQVTHHLVGVAELAARWGISPQAVSNLVKKGLLPAASELKSGRVWEKSAIEAWEKARQDAGLPIPGEKPRGRRGS